MTAPPALSDREWEALRLVCLGGPRCLGLAPYEAAPKLSIDQDTLSNHLKSVYAKLVAAGAIRRSPQNKRTLAGIWLWRVELAMAERTAA